MSLIKEPAREEAEEFVRDTYKDGAVKMQFLVACPESQASKALKLAGTYVGAVEKITLRGTAFRVVLRMSTKSMEELTHQNESGLVVTPTIEQVLSVNKTRKRD